MFRNIVFKIFEKEQNMPCEANHQPSKKHYIEIKKQATEEREMEEMTGYGNNARSHHQRKISRKKNGNLFFDYLLK